VILLAVREKLVTFSRLQLCFSNIEVSDVLWQKFLNCDSSALRGQCIFFNIVLRLCGGLFRLALCAASVIICLFIIVIVRTLKYILESAIT
jgi:hypothetical protein